VKLEIRIALFDGDVYILYVPKIAQNLRLSLLVALLEPGPNTAYDTRLSVRQDERKPGILKGG
jgi:hypothetical protein